MSVVDFLLFPLLCQGSSLRPCRIRLNGSVVCYGFGRLTLARADLHSEARLTAFVLKAGRKGPSSALFLS